MNRQFLTLMMVFALTTMFSGRPLGAETVVHYDNLDGTTPEGRSFKVWSSNSSENGYAQKFKAGQTDSVTSVTLELSRFGSPGGRLIVGIWEEDEATGNPGQVVGNVGEIEINSLPQVDAGNLPAFLDFVTVEGLVNGLVPGKEYYLVVKHTEDANISANINGGNSYIMAAVTPPVDADRYLVFDPEPRGWHVWGSGIFRLHARIEGSVPPSPANGTTDVPRDVVLSWIPGDLATIHDIYLGTSFEDVNDASRDDPHAVLLSQGHPDPHFAVDLLEYDQTYYWRIDEVNAAPDSTVFKGNVWRFTVEPFAIPIENVQVSASSQSSDAMAPENTINGIGLNEWDQHSTTASDMWLSGLEDPSPWIQYDFDKVYKLDRLWVWNSNQLIESFLGLGARDVVIETSVDGTAWTVLEGATLFNQATGAADYTANTGIDFAGLMAQHVKITMYSGYGTLPQHGLSEVRFLSIPVWASHAEPAFAETTENADVVLKWRAGREAASHQVYFSPDDAAVADGTALLGETSIPSFDLSAHGLELASTYYWRVDELNEAASPSLYPGDVWSFRTPDYIVVDDFDQYDDTCKRIFFAWEDGFGHNGAEDCDILPSSGNGGAAVVGYAQAPFAEQTIVNVDSQQSLPLSIDNSVGQSEATLTLAGQDWTTRGIQTLSLFFYGEPSRRSRQLYVKINDTKLVYDGDPDDIGKEQWQQWNIDLTSLDGLQNVTTFTIGIDGTGANGTIYIDDIRLYP
jgi:hypothetical protein